MQTVAIAPHAQPDAFATGRNPEHAVVCVTEGLLQLVNDDELEGVLAHELGHVKNRDMLLQTVSATMAGVQYRIWPVSACMHPERGARAIPPSPPLALLAPVAAMIIQFAISRQREFKADATGAQISGKPLALASALEKLQRSAERIPMDVSPAVAPLAQDYPLSVFRSLSKLFSTHPATVERVARRRAMASQ
jgi:heat shock protein HtpX